MRARVHVSTNQEAGVSNCLPRHRHRIALKQLRDQISALLISEAALPRWRMHVDDVDSDATWTIAQKSLRCAWASVCVVETLEDAMA